MGDTSAGLPKMLGTKTPEASCEICGYPPLRDIQTWITCVSEKVRCRGLPSQQVHIVACGHRNDRRSQEAKSLLAKPYQIPCDPCGGKRMSSHRLLPWRSSRSRCLPTVIFCQASSALTQSLARASREGTQRPFVHNNKCR